MGSDDRLIMMHMEQVIEMNKRIKLCERMRFCEILSAHHLWKYLIVNDEPWLSVKKIGSNRSEYLSRLSLHSG